MTRSSGFLAVTVYQHMIQGDSVSDRALLRSLHQQLSKFLDWLLAFMGRYPSRSLDCGTPVTLGSYCRGMVATEATPLVPFISLNHYSNGDGSLEWNSNRFDHVV